MTDARLVHHRYVLKEAVIGKTVETALQAVHTAFDISLCYISVTFHVPSQSLHWLIAHLLERPEPWTALVRHAKGCGVPQAIQHSSMTSTIDKHAGIGLCVYMHHAILACRMHPVDWNDPDHPMAQSEPRRGQRAVLAATVQTPQGPLLCYCLHMEVSLKCCIPLHMCASPLRQPKHVSSSAFHQTCASHPMIACMAGQLLVGSQSSNCCRLVTPQQCKRGCEQSRHLQATLTQPWYDYSCLCLQVFCGMLARIEQFADVMHDSKCQIKKVHPNCAWPNNIIVIWLG